jgi:beta-glucanase (GH16 family)
VGDWQDVGVNITAGFHVYGALWKNESICWYFDGQKVAEVCIVCVSIRPI